MPQHSSLFRQILCSPRISSLQGTDSILSNFSGLRHCGFILGRLRHGGCLLSSRLCCPLVRPLRCAGLWEDLAHQVYNQLKDFNTVVERSLTFQPPSPRQSFTKLHNQLFLVIACLPLPTHGMWSPSVGLIPDHHSQKSCPSCSSLQTVPWLHMDRLLIFFQ